MGKLTRRRALRLSRRWAPPILLAIFVIFGAHAIVGADAPNTGELAAYLTTNQLGVYTQANNGYQQVFYNWNKEQVQLTNDGYNHVSASSDGPWVAWEGMVGVGGQIFQHNVLTGQTIQLTAGGTNEYPSVSDDKVVWQAWDGKGWQIMYYNGLMVQQITTDQGTSSIRASIGNQKIIYAEQVSADDWKVQQYDTTTAQTTTIAEGTTAATAYPRFNADGTVATNFPIAQ